MKRHKQSEHAEPPRRGDAGVAEPPTLWRRTPRRLLGAR